MCSSIELLSWTVLFAAETLAIIAGNIITVIVFWKMRSDFKKTYYLLINLSIADLTVGISALEITISKIWNLAISQNIFLKKFLALDVLAESASLVTLMFIALESFLRNNVSFEPQNLNQTGLCPWCFVAVGLWYVSRTDQLLSRAPSRFSISPRCPSDFDISGRDRCVGR